uniref:Uncharacterized protein n=1 Tax=Bracon brevicornis TaxID=1563983 RepID=A0A6V7JKN6_9HYME
MNRIQPSTSSHQAAIQAGVLAYPDKLAYGTCHYSGICPKDFVDLFEDLPPMDIVVAARLDRFIRKLDWVEEFLTQHGQKVFMFFLASKLGEVNCRTFHDALQKDGTIHALRTRMISRMRELNPSYL